MSKPKTTSKNNKLKLVPKIRPQPEARSFWNSCPRKLDAHPTTPCEAGKRSCQAKTETGVECPWFVNSPEHNYCFWTWTRAQSLPNGQMRPLLQKEIAQLLGISATKVHFVEKEAKQKLKESGKLEILKQLMSGGDSGADVHDVNGMVDRLEDSPSGDDFE